MATAVYTQEEILLQDGTEITIRPLAIKPLKVFMKSLDKLGSSGTEEGFVDEVLELTLLCLKNNLAVKDRDDLDEVLDMDTCYKILEICGGVKLNDPKLMEALTTLSQSPDPAGKG